MSSPVMWRVPPRREFRPKAMDIGQPITWTRTLGGWKPGEGWQSRRDVTRAGTIWSEGPYPRSWWVIPDDGRTPTAVLVRTAGRRDRMHGEGTLFQDRSGDRWRSRVRRAELIRRRGIFPVVERTTPGAYDYARRGVGPSEHMVVWHSDPDCPDAAEKLAYREDEGITARGYVNFGTYKPWTAYDVARLIMGLDQIGSSPTPFCARCVAGDPSVAGQGTCAAVTV